MLIHTGLYLLFCVIVQLKLLTKAGLLWGGGEHVDVVLFSSVKHAYLQYGEYWHCSEE